MDIILHKYKGKPPIALKEDLPTLPIPPIEVDYNGLCIPAKVTSDSFWENAINALKEAIAFENDDPEVAKNIIVRTLND